MARPLSFTMALLTLHNRFWLSLIDGAFVCLAYYHRRSMHENNRRAVLSRLADRDSLHFYNRDLLHIFPRHSRTFHRDGNLVLLRFQLQQSVTSSERALSSRKVISREPHKYNLRENHVFRCAIPKVNSHFSQAGQFVRLDCETETNRATELNHHKSLITRPWWKKNMCLKDCVPV